MEILKSEQVFQHTHPSGADPDGSICAKALGPDSHDVLNSWIPPRLLQMG